MKIQRNIIYATVIGSIVSALIYAYCVFQWNPNMGDNGYDLHTYISNIILGVWGSSIISLVLGIVSYSECRRKDMEAFIFSQRALFEHCSSFKERNSTEWFDEYVKLYRDLSNNWANIRFIFDPMRRRLFLKAFVDYYGDFIQLTQDKYYLLKQNISSETKEKLLNDIRKVAIEKQTYTQGITKMTTEYNLLTHDLEIAIKNIDNIYRRKKSFHIYKFEKTLMSVDNFTVLDKENENFFVFCKTFLHKIAKTFCRSLQLHFVGNCNPGWQVLCQSYKRALQTFLYFVYLKPGLFFLAVNL